jgi:hypothetical protein
MGSGAGTDELSYDLFLSYNSADHRIVEEVAQKLAHAGLKRLFLDRWNLLVGTRWRPMLEKALGSSKAVAIFVGPGEMGSWQQREVDIALDLQNKNADFPVIPVLLPGCEPPLGFLRQLTWVDLRTQTLDRGIDILNIAARGEATRSRSPKAFGCYPRLHLPVPRTSALSGRRRSIFLRAGICD